MDLGVTGVSELVLEVVDLEASERFYSEVLGLPVVERWPDREAIWVMAGDRTRIGFLASSVNRRLPDDLPRLRDMPPLGRALADHQANDVASSQPGVREEHPAGRVDRVARCGPAVEGQAAGRQPAPAAVKRFEERRDNPLKRAPHTMQAVVSSAWDRPYTREEAAFPTAETRAWKFWPAVARVESAYGDRNLVCSCVPTDAYAEAVVEG